MNYEFATELISQHVVKYGVHVQPPIMLKDEKTKLQDYCNWLIEQAPEAFETLLSGPNQLRVQKSFVLASNRRVDMPTFILTARGPLFTFPERLYIDQPQDVDLGDKNRIFRKALDELRSRFSDRTVRRVGVIHEMVFDTGQFNSLEIIASNLKSDVWKERVRNLNIHLEAPREGKNVNLDIRPTHVTRARRNHANMPEQDVLFGIIVNVDINNQNIKGDLPKSQVNDILTFAADYVPDELIRFLNNEY
ncbi:MAG: hypothetical protein ISS79_12235 [Phycisphaerae bacterium]|nr:hypothetical protein [Phycisphaerae bacterium]